MNIHIDAYKIYCESGRHSPNVVMSSSMWDWTWTEAQINWGSPGGVSAEYAEEFATKLGECIEIAKWLNGRLAGKDTRKHTVTEEDMLEALDN